MLAALAEETGEEAQASDTGEILGKSWVRDGDWKALRMPEPYGTGAWQLFNLSDDPGETDDLAKADPDTLSALVSRWDAYAAQVGVVMPNWTSGY